MWKFWKKKPKKADDDYPQENFQRMVESLHNQSYVNTQQFNILTLKLITGEEIIGYVLVDNDIPRVVGNCIAILKPLSVRVYNLLDKKNRLINFSKFEDVLHTSHLNVLMIPESTILMISVSDDIAVDRYLDEMLYRDFFVREPELAGIVFGHIPFEPDSEKSV